MDLMTFGSYLKWAREAVDMTQQELAEIIDCAFSTISRIETGKNCPSLKTFRRLNVVFEGFGVQYDEVFMEPIFSMRQARNDLLLAIKTGRSEDIEKKLEKFKECVENEYADMDFDEKSDKERCLEDRQYYVFAHLILVKKQCLSSKEFLEEAIAVFEIRKKFPKYEDIEIIKLSNIEYEILYTIGRAHLREGEIDKAEAIFKGLMANTTNKHSVFVKDKYIELSAAMAKIGLIKNDYKTSTDCLEYIFGKYIYEKDTRLVYKALMLLSEVCKQAGDEKGAELIDSFLLATDKLVPFLYKLYGINKNII